MSLEDQFVDATITQFDFLQTSTQLEPFQDKTITSKVNGPPEGLEKGGRLS